MLLLFQKWTATPAGEPWLGSVVVGGALPSGTQIPEDQIGIPVAGLAEARPMLATCNGPTDLRKQVSALAGELWNWPGSGRGICDPADWNGAQAIVVGSSHYDPISAFFTEKEEALRRLVLDRARAGASEVNPSACGPRDGPPDE